VRCGRFGSFALLPPFVLVESVERTGRGEGDERDEYGPIILAKPFQDGSSVVRAEIAEDSETNTAADGEGGEEFFRGVLHSSGDEQHGDDGKGWRKDGGNGDGGEPPALENGVEPLDSSLGKLLFQGFFAAFARHAIGEVSANDRADGGHDGVVKPGLAMMSGEQDGGHVGAAGKRNQRIIGQTQENEAGPPEMNEPAQSAVRRSDLLGGEQQDCGKGHGSLLEQFEG